MNKFFAICFVLFSCTNLMAQTDKASASGSFPELKWNGDLRYRYQDLSEENKDKRITQRLQARIGLKSQIDENLRLQFRLMTGTSANSGNQDLGDKSTSSGSMSRRSFGLDQAFGEWNFCGVNLLSDSPRESSNSECQLGPRILFGKMAQPFVFVGKNQLMLDRDITPEGVAFQSQWKLSDWKTDFGINVTNFIVREKYDSTLGQDQSDVNLNAVQLWIKKEFDDLSLNFVVGSFTYTGIKGDTPINVYGASSATASKGNTLDVLNTYTNNYEPLSTGFEVKWKYSEVELTGYLESIKNQAADSANQARSLGAMLAYKKWTFNWMTQTIQKDSVFAAFTDSDFADGETASKGQVLSVTYKLTKNANFVWTKFSNYRGVDTGVAETSYNRQHFDLNVQF